MSEHKEFTVNDTQDVSAVDEEYEELDEEEEEEVDDVFHISRKPTVESLKRWRQATLALNAARRFRYTLDLKAKKKEEEAREMLRLARDEDIPTASLKRQLSKFRTGTHVLRAVYRFREAGARARAGRFQNPPDGFGISPDHLAHVVQHGDINTELWRSCGGVHGIAKALNTDLEDGIKEDPEEIQKRWVGFGENKYAKKKNKNFLVFVYEASQDTTLIILMVCAAVALATGIKTEGAAKGWYDGAAIGFAVLLVILVTAISDYKQSLQFRSLNEEKENIQIQVVRGGRRQRISIFEVAVGDIVNLNIGDQVPADGLFVSGHSLTVDESSMTGESDPVHKDSKRPFFMGGCKVVDGHGSMLVTGVGMYTEWGQVMATLSEDNSEETPLQVRLNGAATFIGQIGLSVALLVFIILFIRYFVSPRGSKTNFKDDKGNNSRILDSIVHIFTIAVTIVVVAVPEGLPLAVTLTLAYSMRKMMADKSLVRKLAACETMGSATTICSDKTGTLTLNQMTVVKMWIAGDLREVVDEVKNLNPAVSSAVMDGIGLNTVGDVFIPEGGGEPEVSGSPTEAACLSWGLKIGMLFDQVRSRATILQVETFNSAKKRAGVAARLEDATIRVFWKGAAEIILEECTNWLDGKGTIQQLTPDKAAEIGHVIEGMAAASLRCVAFAFRDLDPTEVPTTEDELSCWRLPECNLTFVVVVGIKDPCRPGVREAVAVCQAAGVKVRMVTGDNIITARAIAQECGILTPNGKVIEGRDFRNLTEEEFKEILPRLEVMARSSPTDKLLLVKKLKEETANSVVAVTGDGTNDAPALHEADIGLSMGISGTEVAKEASDIIILDDNFASVVKVVRWGRSVYANIQKFIQFQLTVNVVALVINFVAACTSGEVPLNAVQLLWVNLIMDTLGALALATEPPNDELMKRKPIGRKEPLITNVMWRNIFVQAAYQVILLLTLNFAGKGLFNIEDEPRKPNETLSGSDRHINTIIFNTFVFCQVFNEFNARKPDKVNVFKGLLKNRLFIGIIVISVVFQILLVQLLGNFADTTKLSWQEWLICTALGSVSLPIAAIFKLVPVREKTWFRTENMFKRKKKIPRRPSGGAGSSKAMSSRRSSRYGGAKADGAKDELIPQTMENGDARAPHPPELV